MPTPRTRTFSGAPVLLLTALAARSRRRRRDRGPGDRGRGHRGPGVAGEQTNAFLHATNATSPARPPGPRTPAAPG
ncbi:hypothetical protein [Streptomyces phaeoluteigriseus]|uniref:hypothetical protein n=1 Tax=Streptomyces phaeoluteigriseus TaxID=114686 RepID=UPI000927BBEE|nr:hypothetical protein [Streptomyces phaeoluteigriseus]